MVECNNRSNIFGDGGVWFCIYFRLVKIDCAGYLTRAEEKSYSKCVAKKLKARLSKPANTTSYLLSLSAMVVLIISAYIVVQFIQSGGVPHFTIFAAGR